MKCFGAWLIYHFPPNAFILAAFSNAKFERRENESLKGRRGLRGGHSHRLVPVGSGHRSSTSNANTIAMPFKTQTAAGTDAQMYYCAKCGVKVRSCNHAG
jgi:hypothetical protein